MIELSWKLKLPSLSTKNKSSSPNTFHKSNSQLIDGLFLPPSDPTKLDKLLKKQFKDSAGKNWFDIPAQIITPGLKKDLQLLKVCGSLSALLQFFHEIVSALRANQANNVGLPRRREKQPWLADEQLLDGNLCEYRKRKLQEIEEVKRPTGVEKWKLNKSRRHTKAGKGKENKTRL
ncbi:hypothetical protein DH2020_012894 [Rehmannia glutinosa]|uniref:Fcf2 pre-rRNA processing C-terminal domain-containing protein n=1 Tax=Rehmannia glutinosa TaxID=99300 RepID=A0ABR0X4J5_REHGL